MPISRTVSGWSGTTSGASAARVPGVPVFSANGSGTIDFTFSTNGNDSDVVYAIYVTVDSVGKGYLKADGTDNGATEVWQAAAQWGTVQAKSLTDFKAYQFKVKGKNGEGVETAFSADSAVMNTLPDIDYGVTSDNLERIITGGNTIVDDDYGLVISGNEVPAAEASQDILDEYYGDITITYKLKNNSSTASRIVVEYSKDNSTWYTATKGTGGDAITGLTTSAAGVSHTFVWDSYSDGGTSLLDQAVYIRITPYDASPTGGDAADTVTSDAFVVNNRPAKITWLNADGYTFDKDTTPVFMAVIPLLRGGTIGFPEISFYKTDGNVLVRTKKAVEDITGWEYETSPATWVSLAVTGIPSTAIDGVNRMRYTVQAADALTPDDYYITGRMGEVSDD